MKEYLYYYFDPKESLIKSLGTTNTNNADCSVIIVRQIDALITILHNAKKFGCILFDQAGLPEIESHFNELSRIHNVKLILLNSRHNNYLSITPASWDAITLLAQGSVDNQTVDLSKIAITYIKNSKQSNKQKPVSDKINTKVNNKVEATISKTKSPKTEKQAKVANPDITIDLPQTNATSFNQTKSVATKNQPTKSKPIETKTIETTKAKQATVPNKATAKPADTKTATNNKPSQDSQPQKVVFGAPIKTATTEINDITDNNSTDETNKTESASVTDTAPVSKSKTEPKAETLSDHDFLEQAVHPVPKPQEIKPDTSEAPVADNNDSIDALNDAMKNMKF